MPDAPARPAAGDDAPEYDDFTADVVATLPLTELAEALRGRIDAIILAWTDEVRASIPVASRLPFDHLADNIPLILRALADAVASREATGRRELIARSPSQGITRFQQHYNPRDLMLEDRLLRRHIARHIGEALGRPMTTPESVALNMGLDLMSQQAVVAYIEHVAAQLRLANEAELRYLSFLSHDLNNNLSSVTLWLQVLRSQLAASPDAAPRLESLDQMQQAILTTIGGMGRLLQAERLRHGSHQPAPKPVGLRSLVTNLTRTFDEQARQRGLRIVVDVPRNAVVVSEPELLALVLQNLIGNAAKFASPGTLVVSARSDDVDGGRTRWTIRVVDEGPGIPPEHVDRIFRAFQRGTMEGTGGVGLGLAIASRAAAMLRAQLSVDSTPGRGSTFSLALPPE